MPHRTRESQRRSIVFWRFRIVCWVKRGVVEGYVVAPDPVPDPDPDPDHDGPDEYEEPADVDLGLDAADGPAMGSPQAS